MGVTAAPRVPNWFGQPAGLTILFLTEMWEKFSYYGMRTLLIYYMVKQLLLPQAQASVIYGLYTALVYFTPILGGMLADRWLGRKRAVFWGGSIMAVGHFLMVFEPLFYLALLTIALGNGLYMTNLPSQVESLYAHDDPRRSSAFSVYYVGVNVGALLAPVACGTVGEIFGWHYGFMLAGIGMLLGVSIYTLGGRYLPPDTSRLPRVHDKEERSSAPRSLHIALLLGIALAVAVLRGAYEQIGNTVALWADSDVNRTLASGLTIPMTWFQALNPLLIFIVTPFLVRLWTRQARRGTELGSAQKMAIGAGGIALSYLLLAAVTSTIDAGGDGRTQWIWLAMFVGLLTAAELWVLPVGLGLFARLAPPHLSATIIAAWFLATFAGNLLAGLLGTLWTTVAHASFFGLMACVAAVSSLALLLLSRRSNQVEREVAQH